MWGKGVKFQQRRRTGNFKHNSPFGFVSIDRSNPGPEFGCHSRVVKEGILPETEHKHVSLVSSSKGCEEVLVTPGADLDSVGDD